MLYVVDDDAAVRSLLQLYLGKHGFEVVPLPTADEMLRLLPRDRPDLAIIDLMMPGTGGLRALAKLRAEGDDLPIILLTARGEEIDRIVGLEMGADDYLGKPFNPRELLARIQAVLRRRAPRPAAAPTTGSQIQIGNKRLDLQRRALIDGCNTIQLTSVEFSLLNVLASNPLKLFSRINLLNITQSDKRREQSERSIDVQILRLRRLLELDPQKPKLLQTVRGIGYVFVPSP
jgi:two-component system phosphate regulon response regulator OmpR